MLGFVATWRIGAVNAISSTPSVVAVSGGDVARLLGVAWLVAGAAFIVAAVGIARGSQWWVRLTAGTALLSMVLCTLWWKDAVAGIAIDAALLVVLLAINTRSRLTNVFAGGRRA